MLEEFGDIIASGGSCVVIASMCGHRLPALIAEQNEALATTPGRRIARAPDAALGSGDGRAGTPPVVTSSKMAQSPPRTGSASSVGAKQFRLRHERLP